MSPRPFRRNPTLLAVVICIAVVALWLFSGPGFNPQPFGNVGFQKRAESATEGGVTVSVVALSPEEAKGAVGFETAGDDVQPVWIEVVNHEAIRYFIPPITVDGDYYSPLEVAWKAHGWFSGEQYNSRIDRHLFGSALPNHVEPGAAVSGFVFTRLDEGVKYVSLELIGAGQKAGAPLLLPGAHPASRPTFSRWIGTRSTSPARSATSTKRACAPGWRSCPAAPRAGIRPPTATPSTS